MKKSVAFLLMMALIFSFSMARPSDAANLADGTYTIPYTMLKADSDSASIANGYFAKPAELIVKNGEIVARVKLEQSAWIQSFSTEWNGAQTPVTVVSEDAAANTRVVQYKVKDLSQPLATTMHVVIPEQAYDSKYTVRQSFDVNGLKRVNVQSDAPAEKKAAVNDVKSNNVKAPTAEATKVAVTNVQDAVENPKTGEGSRFGLLMAFFFSSLFIIYRFKASRN